MENIPQNLTIDFTDEQITANGGSIFLARMANQLDLPSLLSATLCLKQRARGASDTETLLALIYSLAQGDGALRDVDRLAADATRKQLLALATVPGSRRAGDWIWLNEAKTEQAAWLAHRPTGWSEKQVYVVVRTLYNGAQKLLHPRHTFILTNRADLPPAEIVRRHRGKQGQENAQKGPLIDLDLHHPPCRRYLANQAFYTLGQLAQLLLVALQYRVLPPTARGHGLRTIIRDLLRTPARLTRHARRWTLRFAKSAFRLDWLNHAADVLDFWARAPG